ncbi:SDR family NAD(P)-dependent oxidoreductase [Elongatibacter sediminis]|uniref:SDR family NAD(P)-dependent oxidoreductase n=1 Tax=Elongatibacter sediminis TaxID=3119006 RepID=A0AAW9RAW2_9GAMM
MPKIIACTPFDKPDPALVAALAATPAMPVLDLGRDREKALAVLARARSLVPGAFAVRVTDDAIVRPGELPAIVDTVVLEAGCTVSRWRPRQVLVQVTSMEEAAEAIAAGANGLIARGNEAGGRVGDETAFLLTQRLAAASLDVPFWVQGGIGRHTAAACVAGGAAGVYLDEQLALVQESQLESSIARAVAGMDGSETVVIHGHRVFSRPDLPVARHLADYSPDEVAGLLGASSLQDSLIPMGQAAAFAGPLARHYRTAAGLVRGFESAMRALPAAAAAAPALVRNGDLAREFATEFPVAQGPMTRVSDQAGFAAAVAEGGGLPFLALSLMRGPQVEELLSETSQRLGSNSWGVGVLGFVPPELREEQLDVIRRFKPPFALIAGGRPSQSRVLEDEGIRTFLHVPSPRLLEMFLKEGARRFVFEGRECGGHVGPRSSFALWEAQIQQLLACDAVAEVQALFAGGIHDARSAAMVSAMAAPLADRGAAVGVLMGTAYLLTREATETGAIQPGFQQAARDCTRTVLLETSPGHATRCVDSEYVRTFERRRDELVADGVPQDQAWMELESLNLGRLRIASKGLQREGDELVSVDAQTQVREGMYMIGQAAVLHDEVCTIAQLHDDVVNGSEALLRAGTDTRIAGGPRIEAGRPRPAPADVAIVGLAGIFPGARDLAEYWSNIIDGRNLITEVPAERWNTDLYYDPEAVGESAGAKTPSKWGGFLPTVAFDPLKWGIPPNSLAAIEPVQLLSLEVAARALADARVDELNFDRERASVIFGAEAGADMSGAYGFRALFQQYVGEIPPELDAVLPSLTEDSFPGVLANVIAGRIANRLDLGGVNYTVDAACASSLAAVDAAVKELNRGGSDLVLCGGADLHNTIYDYLLFSSVHALSPTGQCRTFDATADGIVLGEGIACMALKRLADAERDGDRVYAVIKAVSGSSDGRSLGLTAPRKEGQKRALERAYGQCGVSPAEVGLIEAHGTGTVVGDRTELATLTEVFREAGAEPGRCSLGSVKSQIGHTKCTAGVAGLIKAALSIHHGVRPPTLHVDQPNSAWDPAQNPFEFRREARPWLESRRMAGVSALGFGGTNFHVVLAGQESAALPLRAADEWPAELLLFRGDADEARSRVAQARTWLNGNGRIRLRDLARTLAASGDGPVHVAIVAHGAEDAKARLDDLLDGREHARVFITDREVTGGKLAFVFPGQGSQRVGMLSDLFVRMPPLRRVLGLGEAYLDRIYPPQVHTAEQRAAQKAALTDTRCAQPALGMMCLAVAEFLEQLGIRPDYLAGHSYGELVALCRAGAFDEETLIALSEARASYILEAAGSEPGVMAAVNAAASDVAPVIEREDGVIIANYNAPSQVVISGPEDAVDRAVERLGDAGMSARRIPVACAFHSPLVAGAQDMLAERLAQCDVHELSIPVFSNAAAAPYLHSADGVRSQLAAQVARPVRFADQIEAMYQAGVRIFVEAGPGQVLSGLIAATLRDRPHRVIRCDDPAGQSLPALLGAVGQLAVLGVEVHPEALFLGRDADVVDLGQPPALAPSAWLVNGQMARPASGEAPPHAYVAVSEPVIRPGQLRPAADVAAGTAPDAREQAMIEYLHGMREMIAAQRDVMMQFLGADAAASPGVSRPAIEVTPRSAVSGPAESAEPAAIPAAQAASGAPPGSHETGNAATGVDITGLLLSIVSERTGYPQDMLDLDLDLEAELSIDSIKRIEILGQLREQVALGEAPGQSEDEVIEELAGLKTLRALVDWLESHRPGEDPAPRDSAAESTAESVPASKPEYGAQPETASADTEARVRCYGFRVVDAPLGDAPALNADSDAESATCRLAIVDDGRGIARLLADRVKAAGGEAEVIGRLDAVDDVADLIDLSCLAEAADHEVVPALFSRLKRAVASGIGTLIVASPAGGRFGLGSGADTAGAGPGGAAGLVKSLAHEFPSLRTRVVDLDPEEAPEQLAQALAAEWLASGDDRIEVGYHDGRRVAWSLEALDASTDEEESGEPALDTDSVVVVLGGGRGICARLAAALADRYGCRLELVGRTAEPRPESDETAAARTLAELRQVLVAQGMSRPAEIEAECSRLMAARAVSETLDNIRAAGGQVRYHACDATDAGALESLITRLRDEYGRIDGVIHGAGILEDKLICDKTEASFRRVFDTKVVPARILAGMLGPDTRFVLFFSSVAAVFGNRGQADYAAANDALDKLAGQLAGRGPARVLSVNWGPWSGAGMIGPELAREYARRGIPLIEPEQGVAAAMDILQGGFPDAVQVLVMAGDAAGYLKAVSGQNPREAAGTRSTESHSVHE